MSINRKKHEVVTVPVADPFAVLDQDQKALEAGIIGAIGRAYQTADGDLMSRVPVSAITGQNVQLNRDKSGQFTGSARAMFTFAPEKAIQFDVVVKDEKTGIERKVTLTRSSSFNVVTTFHVTLAK